MRCELRKKKKERTVAEAVESLRQHRRKKKGGRALRRRKGEKRSMCVRWLARHRSTFSATMCEKAGALGEKGDHGGKNSWPNAITPPMKVGVRRSRRRKSRKGSGEGHSDSIQLILRSVSLKRENQRFERRSGS